MSENAPKKDRPRYPSCESTHILKNGNTHHKKPKFLCKTCGRQFIETPPKRSISSGVKEIIKKLLLERFSLIGIARSLGVSMSYKILSIVFIALSLVRCEFYQKRLPI